MDDGEAERHTNKLSHPPVCQTSITSAAGILNQNVRDVMYDLIATDLRPFSSGLDYSGLHLTSHELHDEMVAARRVHLRKFLIELEASLRKDGVPIHEHWNNVLAQDIDLNKVMISLPCDSQFPWTSLKDLAQLWLDEIHIQFTPPKAGHSTDADEMRHKCKTLLRKFCRNAVRQDRTQFGRSFGCNTKVIKISYDT